MDKDLLKLEFYAALEECNGNATKASQKVGINERTARRWKNEAVNQKREKQKQKEKAPFLFAKKELQERATQKDLQDRIATLEGQLLLVETANAAVSMSSGIPQWLQNQNEGKKGVSNIGVPTMFASDWHFGEFVDGKQINNINHFNRQIARDRAKLFFDRGVDLLKNHMVSANYPGIVLAIGGDMVTGDIHEELAVTNDCTTPEALLDLYDCFKWGIEKLANEFGHVFIPCVTGNHGRQTHKMQHKNRNKKNWDWMLYVLLAKHFKDDKRIKFLIPDGTDAHFKIYKKRYCLSHGDQFRGGDGMIGALGPITRGNHKKASRNSAIDMPYDILMVGHWHQLIMLERLIVNGSLKGYDEYASANNFGFERPQQACWITHKDHGVTFRMPIILDDTASSIEQEWIGWKE